MPEKVLQLVHTNGICRHPLLAHRVALKSGTALNLFLFDLPPLSVDIDFNYIGAADREARYSWSRRHAHSEKRGKPSALVGPLQ